MIILGIDPGIGRLGWGVIELKGSKSLCRGFGCFETKTEALESRLFKIHSFLTDLFKQYNPDQAGLEDLFFAANAKTALQVGQARGAILLCLAQAKIPVFSYTPLQVKQSLTGYGRATKTQIQLMVKSLLGLASIPKSDDAADALAIALTHAFSYKMNERVKQYL